MPGPRGTTINTTKMTRKKPTDSSPKPRKDESTPEIDEETSDAYVRGLLARGEAVRAKDGRLPPGTTHEIVEELEGELPRVKRRRFSAF